MQGPDCGTEQRKYMKVQTHFLSEDACELKAATETTGDLLKVT